jgi:hypothetical protein
MNIARLMMEFRKYPQMQGLCIAYCESFSGLDW